MSDRAVTGRQAMMTRRTNQMDNLAEVTAFTGARVGICIADAEGRLLRVNPTYCAQLGQVESELIGTESEIWRAARADDGVAARVDSYGGLDRELKLRRGDGSEFWALVSGQPADTDDPGHGTVWVVRDITPRKQLEESLRRTLSEREAILQTSLVGISVVKRRRCVWVNRTMADMLGYTPEELIGQPITQLYPEHERKIHEAATSALTEGRNYLGEHKLRRKDGREIWGQLAGRAIDADDPSQGAIWVVHDVTERKRLEQDLARTLAERESILKSSPIGISFVVGRRHQWMNDAFAQQLGYEKAELIGQSSLIHHPDRESWEAFGAMAYPLLAAGRPYVGETQMKRKDGTLIWCQLHGNAVDPSDPSKGSIWTNIDMTEHKRVEQEMRRALEQERELNELKTSFIAMTSHEFRTPLATILSSAELIERYEQRLAPEEKLGLLQDIKAATKRMTEMLEQVLLIGRADAGRLAFEPTALDLRALCRKIMDEVRVTAGPRHNLRFSCTGDYANAAVDERLVRHIVGNLLSNAVKYSPGGGTVSLDLAREGESAVVTVADTGIGITAADQSRLYESFHRGQNVRNIPGTGLGLAIVKKAVDQHGGRISVESEVGRGTRFVVVLPLGPVAIGN
jgi:PAS domain S-box-containing protein